MQGCSLFCSTSACSHKSLIQFSFPLSSTRSYSSQHKHSPLAISLLRHTTLCLHVAVHYLLVWQEEDDLLRRLVEKGGAKNWSAVAAQLKGRAGKQCRERWHNHLKRGIKKVQMHMLEQSAFVKPFSPVPVVLVVPKVQK